jgi:hypothetical protein
MNAYDLVMRVADEMNLSPNQVLNGPALGKRKVLHYLNEGEAKTMARLRQPRYVAAVTTVAGTNEYALGTATFDGEQPLPFSTWRGTSPLPPVLNEMITYVRVRTSATAYTQPLEYRSVEALLDDGYDLTTPPSGTPQYYYLRQSGSVSASPLAIGLYPAPSYASSTGIQISYVPQPSNMRWLWGTGISSETITVNVTYDSIHVDFNPATTGITDGLVDGLHFGVMLNVGDYPFHWYSIKKTARIADNAANFKDGDWEDGNWIGFDLDQPYQEQLDSAGVKFVIASPSTFGKHYPSSAELPALYASAILLSQKQDKRNLELKAQYEGGVREFKVVQNAAQNTAGEW